MKHGSDMTDSAPRLFLPTDSRRRFLKGGAALALVSLTTACDNVLPGAGPPPLKEEPVPAKPVDAGAVPAAKAGAATPAGGEVVFTALDENVWIKFYDANGEQLLQKQMAKGERYTVPADAEGPMAWTGRPDAFAITVGGQSVPKLADDDVIVRDVPVTAAALLARDTAPATAED